MSETKDAAPSPPKSEPEPWLRGPVPGIALELQPVAHALLQALEDVERAVLGLSPALLQARPGGAASLAFHLRHIPGSVLRLFTYAKGGALDETQRRELAEEKDDSPVALEPLVAGLRRGVERALEQLAIWPLESLAEPRKVGRAGLPSTTRGLLFHAAEHAQRHAGAVVVTAKVLRADLEKGERR